MAREKVTGARALCMRGYLLTALFSVWINLISGIKIKPIPEYPVVNQPVTLKVNGVRGTIRSISWYKGRSVDRSFLILSYNATYNAKTQGPEFFPQAKVLSDGSLSISGLYKAVRRYYTVQIEAESLTQESIDLPVYVILSKPVISIANWQPEEYKEVTLSCILESETATVSWSRINGSIPSGVKFGNNNRTMTVPRIKQSDTALYQCEAVNPVSKNISDLFPLYFYYNQCDTDSCATFMVSIICGCILGTVLIICIMLLLYKKCVLPPKGDKGQDPSGTYCNIPNTARKLNEKNTNLNNS
ncbi:hypothetical protein XELAEV_18036010mg [Xenopus laevis]|uniref:Ig-like domain-containing protein n=1 Tax=Xenopus laevis TaxID=8355 RepID=A0A974CIV6_XENLA|nr:hypothetical protein XELAEV_18036010mg [Xenopus laevis]